MEKNKKTNTSSSIDLSVLENNENLLESLNSNKDSIAIFRLDSDGNPKNFIEVNPATIALFDYTKEEFLSMSITDTDKILIKKRTKKLKALSSKKKTNFKAIIKNKNGTKKSVEIKTILINYLNKPAIMSIIRDIKDRKSLKKPIQKINTNFALIIESTPDLLLEVDLDGKIHHYQTQKKELTSNPFNMFVGEFFQDLLPKNMVKAWTKVINEAEEKGWSSGKQYSLKLPKGKRWYELSASPVNQNNNSNKHFILLAKDITARKNTEIDLKKNKKTLQVIFDSVTEAVYVIDKKGIFIDVNKGAEKMYQYTRKELIGKSPIDFAAPGLNDFRSIQKKMKVLSENTSVQFEFWAVRKNGEIFSNEVSINKSNDIGSDYLIGTARDTTERKKSEEGNQKIKGIFNLANSGVVLIDSNGNFTEFNDWWLENLNYTSEEMSEISSLEITHPEDIEQCNINHTKLFRGEIDKYQIVKRFVRKDKSFFWGEMSISSIKDNHNTTTNAIGIIIDITERKLSEESLRENEEKYRGLVENSPDGIVIYIKSKIAFINDEGLRMLGAKSKEEIIGKSVIKFLHPDSIKRVVKRMKKVISDKKASQIYQERFIDLEGKVFDVETKAIPTSFNRQDGVQVIIHDITKRKRAEEKIKHLSQAVEQSPVAILITDTNGVIEYVNPKYIETTGFSSDEIIGKKPLFFNPDHSPQDLWKTISSGNEWFGEFKNKKKDGTHYWELASISPILNPQGEITHFIAIKEDITENKKAEEQLISAKERAEESDRLKSSFLANMSHEIRTPMNGILGFTELLKDPTLNRDVQQEYIRIIKKSGNRMLNIINDIISISKIESGQIELTISETDINKQLEYLLLFFKPEAIIKNITLLNTKKLPLEETILETDREKVYAVLTNLIKNAIKFTESGSIEFGCERKGEKLEFFVKDTGMGISNSEEKIIFERFRQVNDTTDRSYQGAGLGLPISKAYVEKIGGKIWIDSIIGKGTTFYFTIPYSSVSNQKNKVIPSKAKKTSAENNIKNLKVLIVEDDPISKLLIKIAIKPFSNEILTASSGFEAIEACRNNTDIDLVMMDINMPKMDGFEATKKIREFNKNLIIIAQTANGMQSDREDVITAGCSDYISKPINISTLNVLIQKHFVKN